MSAALGLLLAILVAYHNSFTGTLAFDDYPAIRDNPNIRTLRFPAAFSPPQDTGLGGRPLANFSFAISHALGGGEVWAHHALNVLLHAGSAMLLFGIVRRVVRIEGCRGADLLRPAWGPTEGRSKMAPLQFPDGVAWVAALLWGLHPLATGSVTYLSQRTELLMGFCLLLTLYCFLRSWWIGSVAACACGMLSKETMATAPLIVLLFDRTFMAGTFRAAWQQRARYYSALAATWLVLGYSLTSGLHLRSVGFGLGISSWDYALTECRALLLYLKLAVWPAPLVFDYGKAYAAPVTLTVACVMVVAGLVGLTVRALVRASAVGFAGACCFLLLAPTSSVIPVAETPMAENRAYLPLAVVVVTAVFAAQAILRRRGRSAWAAAVALGLLTSARNAHYRSELALWTDTVAKRPENARAHFNRGVVLLDLARPAEAVAEFEHAVELNPRDPKARNSLGNALLELGRAAEAIRQFAQAVALEPNYPRAWFNYGTAEFRLGHGTEASAHFERALRLDPKLAEAESALGNVFFQQEQPARALPHYEAALRLNPKLADAHYNGGSACLELGRVEEAIGHFRAAAQLKPTDAEIRNHLGAALARAGRFAEAIAEFEAALRIKPDYADARDNLAVVRAQAR